MAQLYFHCTNPQRIFQDQCGSELDRGLRHFRVETIKLWLGLWRHCFDLYRPELHYMRGPGPRWREKHRRAVHTGPEPQKSMSDIHMTSARVSF